MPINPQNVPTDCWRPLAEYFERLSESFARAAARHEEDLRLREISKARTRAVLDAGEMAVVYAASGSSTDEAIRIVAKLTGLEPAAVSQSFEKARRRRVADNRRTRDEFIRQLAENGCSDREIARTLAARGEPLSVGAINRIVNGRRRPRAIGNRTTPLRP